MRSTAQLALLVAVALTGITMATHAQEACGDPLFARADTAGAITDCEGRALGPPPNAEAHYRAGRWLLARYLAGGSSDADRDRAEQHFQQAAEITPASARYLLALAEAYRTHGDVLKRSQVDRLVDRALDLARTHGTDDRAELEFRAAPGLKLCSSKAVSSFAISRSNLLP